MSSTSLSLPELRATIAEVNPCSFHSAPSRVDRLEPSSEERQGRNLLNVFDLLACGALLLEASGKVDRLNRSAEGYLGKGLVLIHDRLRAQLRDADVALQRLIADAVSQGPLTPEQAVVAVPRPERRPLVVHAVHLAAEGDPPWRAVLVLLDLDQPQKPSEWALRKTFGLTASEARLAIGIAGGYDIKTIAAAYNVQKETLRSQLKAVFAKTGTHRQAELMGLLGRLAMVDGMGQSC